MPFNEITANGNERSVARLMMTNALCKGEKNQEFVIDFEESTTELTYVAEETEQFMGVN